MPGNSNNSGLGSGAAAREAETTEALCCRQGIRFIPMVIESHGGGWSKSARQVLDCVAKHVSASWNEDGEVASLSIAQRLSVTLHRENARAMLKRLQASAIEEPHTDAYAGAEERFW